MYNLQSIVKAVPNYGSLYFYGTDSKYCSVIWDGCSEVQKLVKLQKRFIRIMMDVDCRAPTTAFFQSLGIMPLTERFRYRKALMVYKSLNGYTPTYMRDMFVYVRDAHNRRTRTAENGLVIIPQAKKAAYRRSLAVAGSKHFNSVPKHVRNQPNPFTFKSAYVQSFYNQ